MYSIKFKLLTITLVLLTCFGAAVALYSSVITSTYQRQRLEGIRKLIELKSERTNKVLAEIERDTIHLATSGLLFYTSQSLDIGELSALDAIRSFPTALGGGFWFEPYAYNENTLRMGIHAFFDKEEGEVRLDFIEDDYDYHSLGWYNEILRKVEEPYKVVWIEPYIDDTTNNFVTTAGAGIFNANGDVLGISIIDWDMDGVLNAITEIKPTENSIVVLYDIAHDYIIANTIPNAGFFSRVTLEDSSRTQLSRIIDSVSGIWQNAYDINVSWVMIDNAEYLSLNQIMDNGWHLLVYAPTDEIFMETDRLNKRFILSLLLTTVAIMCLAHFIALKIIYVPIKKLTSGVTQISLDNLNIQVDDVSNDELGMLARAFNKMTVELQKSIEAYAQAHAEKERIKAELNIAAEIQSSLLPCIFPPFPDRHEFELSAAMYPAKEVGGDFFDFFLVDKNNLAVVIADVSGKGVPAALFMVIAKTLIANKVYACEDPAEVFEAVNKTLCENNEAMMFVTAFMGYYNIPSGRFIFVNAGHNPPLVKKSGNDYVFLTTKPCAILGWKENAVYREEEIILEPGDILYMYTDGVTEAMNAGGDFFTEQRLLDVLNKTDKTTSKELLSEVKKEIDHFSEKTVQADDITMLVLEIKQYGAEMTTIKKLILDANIDNLHKAIDFVNEELKQHHCPSALQNDIDMAVEEIFMNIVHYAYAPESGTVALYVFIEEKEAVIRFEDTGRPYNPLDQADPDLDIAVLNRKIGGLGIFFVHKLMDKIRYVRLDNKNLLTMRKKIKD
ncbi:MAG: SpoIIE family protein phosphatase [Treponema sp.]|nr:SpoIIE family protein phosphatase [Treponema sp.]